MLGVYIILGTITAFALTMATVDHFRRRRERAEHKR